MNPSRDLQVLLVADFTADGFGALLRQGDEGPRIIPTVTGMAEAIPTLMQPPAAPGGQAWNAALVWVRPGTALPSLAGTCPAQDASERLPDEVAAWADILRRLAERIPRILVVGWSPDPAWLDSGVLSGGGGPTGALRLMEAQVLLSRSLAGVSNLTLLDPAPWIQSAGEEAWVASLWYLAKVPYGPKVFRAARSSVLRQLRRLDGSGPIKLIIVDLDDTLWGGTLGEVGWEGLRVGGHDAVGEAHADFQRSLAALRRRGALLAIASRNDESQAIEALRRHPEMPLRPEDFAAWRINWEDKAANVAALLAELNLGPQSALFLDNDPAQRDRVRGAFPDLLVPEWPDDPLQYPTTLARLQVFDPGPGTSEDAARTTLYAQRRAADSGRETFASLEAWIASLETEVTFEPLQPASRTRALQLLNKTNQMNLRTRRLTDPELTAWLEHPGREWWTVRVRDRFGDAGLCGILGLARTGAPGCLELEIADFVLSCRVMGRGIEEAMAAWATERAAVLGCGRTCAQPVPTERNGPCLAFWSERSGFRPLPEDPGIFHHTGNQPRPRPAGICCLPVALPPP